MHSSPSCQQARLTDTETFVASRKVDLCGERPAGSHAPAVGQRLMCTATLAGSACSL